MCVCTLVLVRCMPRDTHSHGRMECANENVHEKYKRKREKERIDIKRQ